MTTARRRTRQRVIGFTKCPLCEGRLDDGRATARVDTQEYGYGMSTSGKAYRRITPTDVTITWHTDCLADFERLNADSARRGRIEELAGFYTAFVVEGGTDHDTFLANISREGSKWSADEITEALAQIGGQQR